MCSLVVFSPFFVWKKRRREGKGERRRGKEDCLLVKDS